VSFPAPGTYTISVRVNDADNLSDTATDTVTVSAAPTFSISGTVLEDTDEDNVGDVPLAGVELTLSPGGATTTSAANGTYSLTGLADGAYTVTPSLSGYIFVPNPANATVAGADDTGVDFVATAFGLNGDLTLTVSVESCLDAPAPPDDPGEWAPIVGLGVQLLAEDLVTVLDSNTTDAEGKVVFQNVEGDENHGGDTGSFGSQYWVTLTNTAPPSGDSWFQPPPLDKFMVDTNQTVAFRDKNFKF
jgi:hypothetical protein